MAWVCRRLHGRKPWVRSEAPPTTLSGTYYGCICDLRVYQGAEKKHLLGAILDHCRERLEAAWNSTVTSGLKNIDRSNPKAVWNHIHEYSKKISTSVGDAPMEINVKVVLDAHFTPVSGCLLMPTTLLNAAKSLATLFSAQPRGRYAWLDLLGTDTRTARQ